MSENFLPLAASVGSGRPLLDKPEGICLSATHEDALVEGCPRTEAEFKASPPPPAAGFQQAPQGLVSRPGAYTAPEVLRDCRSISAAVAATNKNLHQQPGVSLATYSRMTGISVSQLKRYAAAGRIIGARKHSLTKKWWIYPPVKLVIGRLT